jgi:hypothetical protein
VSGLKILTDVNVTIRSATHTHPDDLDVLLVGPTGRTAIIWSDAGGTNAITGTTLTLDEDAPVALPDSGKISAQAYKTPTTKSARTTGPRSPRAATDRSRHSTGQTPPASGSSTFSTTLNNLTRVTGAARASSKVGRWRSGAHVD